MRTVWEKMHAWWMTGIAIYRQCVSWDRQDQFPRAGRPAIHFQLFNACIAQMSNVNMLSMLNSNNYSQLWSYCMLRALLQLQATGRAYNL